MCTLLRFHYMRHTGFDVTEETMFSSYQIAIAHQCDAVTVDTDNPVHHISAAIHPCQHHVAYVYESCAMQDDALLAPDDKRQHLCCKGDWHLCILISNYQANFNAFPCK